MANYIGWYLVELERRFKGILPMRKIIEIQHEVEDHMRSSVAESVSQKIEASVAERLAVESFGSPQRFVRTTLRQLALSQVSPTLRRIQAVSTVVLFALMGIAGTFYRGLPFALLLWLLIPYAILSYFTATTPWKTLVATCAIATPILMVSSGMLYLSGWYPDTYFSRSSANSYISIRRQNLRQIESSKILLNEARRIYGIESIPEQNRTLVKDAKTTFGIDPREQPASVAAKMPGIPSWLMNNGEFLVPSKDYEHVAVYGIWRGQNVRQPLFFEEYELNTTATREMAAGLWKARGSKWASLLDKSKQIVTRDLGRIQSDLDHPNLSGSTALKLGGVAVLWTTGFVLLSSLIPASIGRIIRLRKIRRRVLA